MTYILNKIKDIANKKIFSEFEWDESAKPFSKCNVIYGRNGTGKTTISRMLNNVGNYKGCLDLKAGIDQKNIKVFSQDFIRKEMFFDNNNDSDITPILYLGEDSIKLQDKLKKLKKAIGVLKDKAKLLNTENNNKLSAQAKHIKKTYGTMGSGENDYSGYDIRGLKPIIHALHLKKTKSLPLSSQKKVDLESIIGLKIGEGADKVSSGEILYLQNLEEQKKRAEKILKQSSMLNKIQILLDDPPLNKWVREGLHLHEGKEYCQFCSNKLTLERREILQSHFDESYQQLEEELIIAIEECKEIECPQDMEDKIYPELKEQYKKCRASLIVELVEYNNFQENLKSKLKEKQKMMLKEVSLDIPCPNINIPDKYKEIQTVITEHKQNLSNIENKKKEALNKLVDDYIHTTCLKPYSSSLQQYGSILADISQQETKEEKIEKIASDKTTHAKEINEKLEICFKHKRIKFENENNGYKIKRDGEIAYHLSEGEKNIIGLVYFLQILSKNNIFINEIGRKNVCVVIDDPVSSLDEYNFYYAIGILIEEGLKKGQFIILTHNIAVLDQCNRAFKRINNTTNYYELELKSNNDRPGDLKIIAMHDGLLQTLSEYFINFKFLYENEKKKDSLSDSEKYLCINSARSLIESFCRFNYPAEDINNGMKKMFPDGDVYIKILKVINTGSHGNNPMDHRNIYPLLNEVSYLLTCIMQAIENKSPTHYQGMLDVISPNNRKDSQNKTPQNDTTYKYGDDSDIDSQTETNNGNRIHYENVTNNGDGVHHQNQELKSSDKSSEMTDEKNEVKHTHDLFSSTNNQPNITP